MTISARFAWLASIAIAGCQSPAELRVTSRQVAPKWSIDVGGSLTSLRVPVVTSAAVIVGGNGTLVGLDPADGHQKWVLQVPFLVPYAGVVAVSDSLAAVVSADGFVTFDPRDGRAIHSSLSAVKKNLPSGTLPQILSDKRIVFADGPPRHLLALDAASGRLDTLVRLPGDTARGSYVVALAVFRDTIYAPVASNAPRGAAFKNTIPYRFAVGSRALDSLAPDPSDSASLTRWIIASDRLLVSATDYSEPSWLGFDRVSGARRWKVSAAPASLGPSSQVAVVGDTLFAGGNDGNAYVMQLSTGALIQTNPIPDGVVSGVAACGGDVLINVVGHLLGISRDGKARVTITGLRPGNDAFLGDFGTGSGLAVIGNGSGLWIAFAC